jgi:hypothetical protein
MLLGAVRASPERYALKTYCGSCILHHHLVGYQRGSGAAATCMRNRWPLVANLLNPCCVRGGAVTDGRQKSLRASVRLKAAQTSA